VLRRAYWQARKAEPTVRRGGRALRRATFLARLRLAAEWVRADVDVQIAADVSFGRGIRVYVQPDSHNVLRIGPGSSVGDRVLLMLKGGEILLGPRVELRHDVVLNVAGRLELRGDNPVSYGSVVHCSNSVLLHELVGVAEHVTIADSSHYFTTPEEHFWHNVRRGEVEVGRNTWICPKVTLTRGARVGAYCIVGSGSVVGGEVPDGSLASGVPATIRPLHLPWRDGPPS
jgi:acetyltransferase-like isoleucine patch superfamily enzyme